MSLRIIDVLSLCLLFISTGLPSGDVVLDNDCYDLTTGNSGYLSLFEKAEKGEHMIIYGQVVDKVTADPIKNAGLYFYQADQHGEYNSVLLGIPRYAKIRGNLKTGENGCFKIETIVPGNYPGQKDGKHIHVIAKARKYQDWKFEFLFEGWINNRTMKEIEINGDAIILDLKDKENGIWIVESTIPLEPDL